MSNNEDWSRFIIELAELSDEELMSEWKKTTFTLTAAKSKFAGPVAKKNLPWIERGLYLIVDEAGRRGLKYDG
jgi:hypothetical protein